MCPELALNVLCQGSKDYTVTITRPVPKKRLPAMLDSLVIWKEAKPGEASSHAGPSGTGQYLVLDPEFSSEQFAYQLYLGKADSAVIATMTAADGVALKLNGEPYNSWKHGSAGSRIETPFGDTVVTFTAYSRIIDETKDYVVTITRVEEDEEDSDGGVAFTIDGVEGDVVSAMVSGT